MEPLAARDVEALADFMDASITAAMARHDISGGVFVVVGDGRVARAQGTGTPTSNGTRLSMQQRPASTSSR